MVKIDEWEEPEWIRILSSLISQNVLVKNEKLAASKIRKLWDD